MEKRITMLLDKELLDQLSKSASENPRLRASFDLRNTDKDDSQRMLNALQPGTILPIHRHPFTAETLIMVRGSVCQKFYNEKGVMTDTFVLKAGGECSVLQIPAGQFHSLECLEPNTVIFEAKDGAYMPVSAEDIL